MAPGTMFRARVKTSVFPLAVIDEIATLLPALVKVKSEGSK